MFISKNDNRQQVSRSLLQNCRAPCRTFITYGEAGDGEMAVEWSGVEEGQQGEGSHLFSTPRRRRKKQAGSTVLVVRDQPK